MLAVGRQEVEGRDVQPKLLRLGELAEARAWIGHGCVELHVNVRK